MKKTVLFLLAALACLVLGSCSNSDGGGSGTDTETLTNQSEPEESVMNKPEAPLESGSYGLSAPAEIINIVLDDGSDGRSLFSARVLQGVINKKQPRVYIAPSSQVVEGTDIESVKQSILRDYGNVQLKRLDLNTSQSNKYAAFWTLFTEYADEIENIYVYEPDGRLADTANIAAMLAGRNNGVAVTSELCALITGAGYELPVTVVKDFCGFTDDDDSASINKWISENMVTDARDDFVFCLKPSGRDENSDGYPAAYDLAVACGALIYYVDPTDRSSLSAQKSILGQFPDNIPVIGWSGWQVEGEYVRNISKLGKYVCCADWGYPNGSVWAAFTPFEYGEEISPIPDKFDVADDKIYVSFMLSDGDAWHYCSKELLSSWSNSLRGSFPMAWTIPSLYATFNPLMLRYLYATKTDNDTFVQGPSGIGYMYPSYYPEAAYPEYLVQTKAALARIGINTVNYWDISDFNAMTGTDDKYKQLYASESGVKAMLLGHSSHTGAHTDYNGIQAIEEWGNFNGAGTKTADDIVGAVEAAVKSTKSGAVYALINVEAWGTRLPSVDEAIKALAASKYADRIEYITVPQLIAALG